LPVLARSVGIAAGRTALLWFILFAIVFAGSTWLAINRLGYRRATMSVGRTATVGGLALAAALLFYGMERRPSAWGSVAGLAWVFATVGLFKAVLRGSSRAPDRQAAE
jgi:hypothetical protein